MSERTAFLVVGALGRVLLVCKSARGARRAIRCGALDSVRRRRHRPLLRCTGEAVQPRRRRGGGIRSAGPAATGCPALCPPSLMPRDWFYGGRLRGPTPRRWRCWPEGPRAARQSARAGRASSEGSGRILRPAGPAGAIAHPPTVLARPRAASRGWLFKRRGATGGLSRGRRLVGGLPFGPRGTDIFQAPRSGSETCRCCFWPMAGAPR